MQGIFTRFDNDRIIMASTDGFRLSVCSGKLISPVTEPRSILIPARAASDVARIIGDQQEPISISIAPSHGQVLFHLKDIDVVAQLIDQKFPNYEGIIPKRHETRATVNTAEFLKACKLAAIFARDSQDAVRVSIKPADGAFVVAARSDETGDNQIVLDAADGGVQISGPQLEIGFNAKYLIEVIGVLDEAQLALETTTARSAGMIRPIGNDDFLHVLMPINLTRS
jgi:DNA polymerase-3 subunit beta